MPVRFVKEHLIGIIVGIILYELYYRSQTFGRGQGGSGG
jgi:hypothetical protein